MAMYQKESLELLRQRIDLVEVITPHLQLQRTGASYKACCPFHNEQSPSFVIQKGENHYHCYGCGAHGDAIAFMMNHLKMSFTDAIETLAERFQVHLEKAEGGEEKKGPGKTALKEVLEKACQFYQFVLLHTEEGRVPLEYLYKRGLTLDFIQKFRIGLSSKEPHVLQRLLESQGASIDAMEQAGLLKLSSAGRMREFFSDRIMFPICNGMGGVIGFSGRKFKEDTFGGKYINTPETPLFKKSQTLYGLSYSRSRIAKERRVIVVEGQIDALRLIDSGFDYTVAGQGTAFGEGHVKELLHLGVNHAFLALDGDEAGIEAAIKIGNFFQKKGVEVSIVLLPKGSDPDTILKDLGPQVFQKLLDESVDYLTFFYRRLSQKLDVDSPSKKNELVSIIAEHVRSWEEPLMVHESLRKLASIAKVPENILNVGSMPEIFLKTSGRVNFTGIDPDRILEIDLLRWILFLGESQPRLIEIVRMNLQESHFRTPICRRLFSLYLEKPRDLFSLAIDLEEDVGQTLLDEIMLKKVNMQKAEENLIETVKKILLRGWMAERELIKMKIHSGNCTDDEALELARQFDLLRKTSPEVVLPI
ncbi:MAG: DNA primase [Chlamydiota bacterium]